MTPFCASCIDGTDGLERAILDEREVLLCSCCREEHPRSGRWSFEGGRDTTPHRAQISFKANGIKESE